MKLTFLGAAREVTGSCTLLQIGGKNIMIDCGMEQGRDIFENTMPPVEPSAIDCVFLTHAHVDHTGNLPLLYKKGFRGPVYATNETYLLCDIMLRDSAHIQMSEAEWKSRKAKRAGRPPVEPLYDISHVEGLMHEFHPCTYGQRVTVNENIIVRFTDIGHLLGSSCIEMWLKEGDTEKKLVFSGDIGNVDQPIINDPSPVKEADFLVIESTYGDRFHGEHLGYEVARDMLARHIQTTLDRGGNVIIPSFAVGRTQEMLYFIRDIKNSGLVTGHPDFPVVVDSPLANEATNVFLQCGVECFDKETRDVMLSGDNPLVFPGLQRSITAEDSKALNMDSTPKVIISGSGMCNAGRIRHHLKHNLWRPECTVLFVGYQSEGTLGRELYDGADSVKIFGEVVSVRAQIDLLPGVSGHADKKGLLNWVDGFEKKPAQIFVNHGDDDSCREFTRTLNEEKGLNAFAPYSGTEFNLKTGKFVKITEGIPVKKPDRRAAPSGAVGAQELAAAAERLLTAAKGAKNLSAEEAKRIAEQIRKLTQRLEK
ncbi:MAG: MBL fold metallo-hydrolase [Oscillospiraceae bacterium]|nr:MBL fold metallo-hydrolase [Oscillospiraceae bacterium]